MLMGTIHIRIEERETSEGLLTQTEEGNMRLLRRFDMRLLDVLRFCPHRPWPWLDGRRR